MSEDTNDKILFRQTRYPSDQAPTLPKDLMWAVGEQDYITGGVGGGKSTVGSIVFAPNPSAIPTDPKIEYGPEEVRPPTVPTPTIEGVSSSNVYQTVEGVSKADVYITVNGMEGVEYEVVVTAA